MAIINDGGVSFTFTCKCGNEEIFESANLSRCLRCGKATPRELSGKEHYEMNKNNKALYIDR